MIPATDALQALRDGNHRFVSETRTRSVFTSRTRRGELVAGQKPFAIILGCSDSRVPAEIIFDQSLGDLFVIRVAGNIAAPPQIGSVELAAEQFGTRLVVVLGHSRCGAVQATFEELVHPTPDRSPNFDAIVDRIRPSVEPLLAAASEDPPGALVEQAVLANARAAARQLRRGSQVLDRLIEHDGLVIVVARYALETGVVEFFDSAAPAL